MFDAKLLRGGDGVLDRVRRELGIGRERGFGIMRLPKVNAETVRSGIGFVGIAVYLLQNICEVAEQGRPAGESSIGFARKRGEILDIAQRGIELVAGFRSVRFGEQSVGVAKQEIQRCYGGCCHGKASFSDLKGRA